MFGGSRSLTIALPLNHVTLPLLKKYNGDQQSLRASRQGGGSEPTNIRMKILVWNCKMGFSEKRRFVRHLCPDIAVIPECSKGSIEASVGDEFDGLWFGENPNKGLGVLVAKPWRILDFREPNNKWVVPLWIGGPIDFLLLAVWTGRVKGSDKKSYIGQACEAVECNPEWFNGTPVVMCGDFNSNAIWDENKTKNHSWLVRFLGERQIVSAYHSFFSENHGEEKRATHYFYHRRNRGFHIDYVFLPEAWAKQIERVEVGEHEEWAKVSDHVPLIVDVALGQK
jgi:hypothetical protein